MMFQTQSGAALESFLSTFETHTHWSFMVGIFPLHRYFSTLVHK